MDPCEDASSGNAPPPLTSSSRPVTAVIDNAALAKIKGQLETSAPVIVEAAKRIARGEKQQGDPQTVQKFLERPG